MLLLLGASACSLLDGDPALRCSRIQQCRAAIDHCDSNNFDTHDQTDDWYTTGTTASSTAACTFISSTHRRIARGNKFDTAQQQTADNKRDSHMTDSGSRLMFPNDLQDSFQYINFNIRTTTQNSDQPTPQASQAQMGLRDTLQWTTDCQTFASHEVKLPVPSVAKLVEQEQLTLDDNPRLQRSKGFNRHWRTEMACSAYTSRGRHTAKRNKATETQHAARVDHHGTADAGYVQQVKLSCA